LGYKQALGILMLAKQYTAERLEQACQRGAEANHRGFHIIENILKNGMDKENVEDTNSLFDIDNPNIRGANYYQ